MSRPAVAVWVVLIAGITLKTALLLRFPALYGGDTVFHVRNHERLFLGHQPPMLQILIFLTHHISTSPLAPRVLMVVLGSFAGAGFYLLCTQWMSAIAALWAGVFFVTSPFLNEISLVPFQEILMAGLLCFAVYSYKAQHRVASALFLGVAAWTRYEGWLLCPVLAFDYLIRRERSVTNLLRAVVLFGLGPISWIALHHGLTSSGSYAIEWPRSPARLVRIVYLTWVCVKETSLPLLFCVGVCLWYAWRYRRSLSPGWGPAVLFIFLYVLAILGAAHGIGHPGMPNPELFLGAREATLLVCFTLLLGAVGFSRLLRTYRRGRGIQGLGAAVILFGSVQSWMLVRSQAEQPEPLVSYQVAQYLGRHATRVETVLFVAKPFSAEDWAYYLEQAGRLGGPRGLAAARASLQELDLSPMDYQRTAVQTDLPESHLIANGSARDVQWIVVWNNVPLPEYISEALVRFKAVASFDQLSLRATVFRRMY